jgi:hypothetical protein
VLMDSGSSLYILYAHTLRLMGIDLDQLRPSTTSFHGVAPGKRVQALGQSTSQSGSAHQTTSARRHSPSRWWGFGVRTTPSSGVHATPNSWRSRTTCTLRGRWRAKGRHHSGLVD